MHKFTILLALLLTIPYAPVFCCQNDNSSEPAAPPAWITKVAELVTLEQLQTAFEHLAQPKNETHRTTIDKLFAIEEKCSSKDFSLFKKKLSLEINSLAAEVRQSPAYTSYIDSSEEKVGATAQKNWLKTATMLRTARTKTLQEFAQAEKTASRFITLLMAEGVESPY